MKTSSLQRAGWVPTLEKYIILTSYFLFFPQPFKPVRKDAFLWVVCDELWLYWLWGYYPRKRVLRTWSHLLGSHHGWHGVAPSYFTASNANLTTETLSQRSVSGQQRYRELQGCVACLKHSPRSLQQMDNSSSPAALRFCLSSREVRVFWTAKRSSSQSHGLSW